MPVYLFQHPTTEEIIEVVQGMKEDHIFVDENGTEWNRVYTKPNAAIGDNLINADTSAKEFARKTADKNYSLGDMWNLSAELSEKRKRVNGKDPIKEKTKKSYERKTRKRHPQGGSTDGSVSV